MRKVVVAALAVVLVGCSSDDSGDPAGSGGSAGNGGSSGSGAGSGGGSAAGGGGSLDPNPQFVPKPTGACPEFAEGRITVSPAGIPPREVQIWMSSEATTLDGPLIFYWHGTGSQPGEALWLGTAQIDAIKQQGGIIASPAHDPAAGGFPWFMTTNGSDTAPNDDLMVADEVLACAIEKVGVDLRRIHTMGMSAGGLQTVQMSFRRSGYIASAVPYSGGKLGDPPIQDPSNKFAAMIFHGGVSDKVVIPFQQYSEEYRTWLLANGHFAFICDHGRGHSVPVDAAASIWQFVQDHPFGTVPSPYATGLPAGFPAYCQQP